MGDEAGVLPEVTEVRLRECLQLGVVMWVWLRFVVSKVWRGCHGHLVWMLVVGDHGRSHGVVVVVNVIVVVVGAAKVVGGDVKVLEGLLEARVELVQGLGVGELLDCGDVLALDVHWAVWAVDGTLAQLLGHQGIPVA